MEYISGNIFVRMPQEKMRKGLIVVGHRHNFDHTTYVKAGTLRITVLANKDYDPLKDMPIVEKEAIISHGDEINWLLIERGKHHVLEALEDGTVYQCIYAHRAPQAITEAPGEKIEPPITKRDDGHLWMRIDETIVQEATGWEPSNR